MEQFEIFIEEDYPLNQLKIWLIENTYTGKLSIHFNGEYLVKITLNPNKANEAKPLVIIPREAESFILKELVDYQIKRGTKTSDENLLLGKLEATEKHLTDIRDIAFKLLNSKLQIITT